MLKSICYFLTLVVLLGGCDSSASGSYVGNTYPEEALAMAPAWYQIMGDLPRGMDYVFFAPVTFVTNAEADRYCDVGHTDLDGCTHFGDGYPRIYIVNKNKASCTIEHEMAHIMCYSTFGGPDSGHLNPLVWGEGGVVDLACAEDGNKNSH